MNSESNSPMAWPKAAWIASIAGIFAVQMGLILVLSPRFSPTPRSAKIGTAVSSLAGSQFNEQLADRLPFNDPALFALASAQGFSGPAWLELPRKTAGITDWNEAERWMNQDAGQFGKAFLQQALTQSAPALLLAEKPVPSLSPVVLDSTARKKPVWQVDGDLSRRDLLTPFNLKIWPHDDVLADTIVQVTVDAAGWVRSAAVISNPSPKDSTQQQADRYALDLARRTRFQPVTGGIGSTASSLAFGRLIFQWATSQRPAGPASDGK